MLIKVAHSHLAEMRRQLAPQPPMSTLAGLAWPQIEGSSLFPFRTSCIHCDGSGEGMDSTYCRSCAGAGETKTVGIVLERHVASTVLTERLPPRFQPYFPRGMVAFPQLCRGLS